MSGKPRHAVADVISTRRGIAGKSGDITVGLLRAARLKARNASRKGCNRDSRVGGEGGGAEYNRKITCANSRVYFKRTRVHLECALLARELT